MKQKEISIRTIQRMIHQQGYTTNTARVPQVGHACILVDLTEKESQSSNQSIQLVRLISFNIQAMEDPSLKLITEETWLGELFAYTISTKENKEIRYSLILNTQINQLTINIYKV